MENPRVDQLEKQPDVYDTRARYPNLKVFKLGYRYR